MKRIIFVPGADVFTLNQLAGTATEIRLIGALELWHEGGYDYFLVSGGLCESKEVQTIPIGELMKSWLTTRGISEDKIIVESEALDTYENISEGMNALTDEGINPYHTEITVVSQWQHALRIALTCFLAHGLRVKRHGLHYREPISRLIMEWIMLVYHLLDREGKGKHARRNRAARRARSVAPSP